MDTSGQWRPFHELMPPDRPPSVWALGLTFADHVRETGERAGAAVVFAKPCRPEPGATHITMPSSSALRQCLQQVEGGDVYGEALCHAGALLDYEVEVGMVLLADWHPSDSHSPRWGFVLVNDVTARSVQMAGLGARDPLRHWSAAKGFPGFLPAASSVWCPDANDLSAWPQVTLSTRVNGELRQRAPLSDLLYSPLQLLTLAAQCAPDGWLRQGDVVLAGTPAGIALQVSPWKRRLVQCLPRRLAIALAWRAQSASPRFLKVNDRIDMQADWLGSLSLTVKGAA